MIRRSAPWSISALRASSALVSGANGGF